MRIEDVRRLAEKLTGQKISYDKAWWWLRKRLKIPYRKPYPKNKKTPPNAEDIMRRRLEEGIDRAVDLAIEKGYPRIRIASNFALVKTSFVASIEHKSRHEQKNVIR